MIIHLKQRNTTVYLYFNYNRKEIYITTGVRAEAIKDVGKAVKKGENRAKIVQHELIIIEQKKKEIYDAIAVLESQSKEVTGDSIRAQIIETNKPPVKTSIDNAIFKYLGQCKVKNTYKKINQLRSKFKRFTAYSGHEVFVEDMTEEIFKEFRMWLAYIDKRVSKKGTVMGPLNNNTIATHVSSLHTVLSFVAPEQAWKYVKHKSEYFNVVYLHPEEITLLANSADKLKPSWLLPRDIFLCMCYTGVRHSDVQNLVPDNYLEYCNSYSIFQVKTQAEAYPPSSPGLQQILARYAGKPPYMSNQKLNKALKKIFTRLRITRKVLLRKEEEETKLAKPYPLNEVITSHVARKTFIMTLLANGVPLADIMNYTGHSSAKTMEPYVTVNLRALSKVTAKIQNLYPAVEKIEKPNIENENNS